MCALVPIARGSGNGVAVGVERGGAVELERGRAFEGAVWYVLDVRRGVVGTDVEAAADPARGTGIVSRRLIESIALTREATDGRRETARSTQTGGDAGDVCTARSRGIPLSTLRGRGTHAV